MKKISTSGDEVSFSEDEMKEILFKELEQLWSKASRIFLGLDKPTKSQELTLKQTRKVFEAEDSISAVYAQTIGNLFVDLFDEKFCELTNVVVEDYVGKGKTPQETRDETLSNYISYIDRMMK